MNPYQQTYQQQGNSMPFNFSQPPPNGQRFPPTNYPPTPSFGPSQNTYQTGYGNPPTQRTPFPTHSQQSGSSHFNPSFQPPFMGPPPSGQPTQFSGLQQNSLAAPYQASQFGPLNSFNAPQVGHQPPSGPFGPPFAPPHQQTFSGPPPPGAGHFSVPPPGPHPSVPSNFQTPPPGVGLKKASALQVHGQVQARGKSKLSSTEIGRQKLDLWLQKIRKPKRIPKHESSGKGPKMWEFIQVLAKASQQLASLSSQIEEMDKVVATADNSVWDAAVARMNSLKHGISSQDILHSNKQVVEQMEKKLQERRKKRARIKRARKEKYEASLKQKEEWEMKGKMIDAWQEKYFSEIKEENKKKARKAAADKTLSKVNKEISDANRLIETMTALQKLRLIRRDAAEKRGDADLGESRESFEQKITDMIRLVKGQLEFYKEEETRLKSIIKSEVEESNKKEQEILEEQNMARQMQEDAELKAVLFGLDEKAHPTDLLFPFEKFYKQAEDSLQAFLSIRQQWDAFLATEKTPGASCIPSSWVIPDEPSSNAWASALK